MRRFFQERKRKKDVEGIFVFNENNITIRNQINQANSVINVPKNEQNYDFLHSRENKGAANNLRRFVIEHFT